MKAIEYLKLIRSKLSSYAPWPFDIRDAMTAEFDANGPFPGIDGDIAINQYRRAVAAIMLSNDDLLCQPEKFGANEALKVIEKALVIEPGIVDRYGDALEKYKRGEISHRELAAV